ncbi:MAG: hypothetical protein IJ083_15185 [Clostridia bacterium]|nr:hypothetical protein [Clostridia bacterium]
MEPLRRVGSGSVVRWTEPLPDIPKDAWCDFRRAYEGGMTLAAIAEKFHCDPRTVRRCILENRSSQALGQQTAPRKLDGYQEQLRVCVRRMRDDEDGMPGVLAVARKAFEELSQAGYRGGLRTVQNQVSAMLREDRQGGCIC